MEESVRERFPIEPSALFSGNTRSGNRFVGAAPEGGMLVGLRLGQGTNWGGAINAIQPIYRLDEKQVHGRRYGMGGGRETQYHSDIQFLHRSRPQFLR